jgi:hypothetical protein
VREEEQRRPSRSLPLASWRVEEMGERLRGERRRHTTFRECLSRSHLSCRPKESSEPEDRKLPAFTVDAR